MMSPAAVLVSRRPSAVIAAVGLLLAAPSIVSGPVAAQPASLVGTYDGGQMEIAAGLELRADGRFNYAMSYGALDEEAAGRWALSGDRVLLTSNPVVAPRFVLVARGRGGDGMLRLELEVPNGLSRQYFSAVITRADGRTQRVQLSENGLLLPFARDNAPVGIRMLFPVYNVTSEPLQLGPNPGYSVRFRFEPNDLGKVDFRAEPVMIVNGELILERHGRTLRFRRTRQ
jgi:hypothetical protein